MYSGQLDLGAQETSEIRFRFVARAPHFVVVPGQRTGIEAERAPSKDGTYAAFTTTAPIEESDFVAMIDPGLPGALQQTVRALFPALLRHYRDALGERPRLDGPASDGRIVRRRLSRATLLGDVGVRALARAGTPGRRPRTSTVRLWRRDRVDRLQRLTLAGYSLTARADAPARFQQVALEAGKPGARWLAVGPAAAR